MGEIISFDSNEIITTLILTKEQENQIGSDIVMYFEDNLTKEQLSMILNYLKWIPVQGEKMLNLIFKIGIDKTIYLIENINRSMFLQLLIYVNADKFSEVYKEYSEEEIVEYINKYHYYSVSIERNEHILIKSLNEGTLPNIFEKMKFIIFNFGEKINNILKK